MTDDRIHGVAESVADNVWCLVCGISATASPVENGLLMRRAPGVAMFCRLTVYG
jgi:hypothetical protein